MVPLDSDQVLRPRKKKWALLLLICLGFVAGGLLMLRDPHVDQFKGYFCVIFFGASAVVVLVQFVPGSNFLRLDSEGLTVRTIWRTQSLRWSDIERFGVAEFSTTHGFLRQRHQLVGYDYSASYPHVDQWRTLKNMNRGISGFEASLPDNYGWDNAELAEHLNTLKARYENRR
jgi:Bacterial PH domain